MGAAIGSKHFYLRVKGETEEALARLRFRRLDIVRPGLLRGRRSELRLLERLAMWFSRYWIIVPVLAVAGSMAGKRISPATSGTLPTYTPVFVLMLVAVVVVVGALTFVPALALGPIVEHLQLSAR